MPMSGTLSDAYAGKRVLVTGHTGFKGAWLCEWLLALGAEVAGFSLPSPTSPALFDQLELAARLGPRHRIADLADLPAWRAMIEEFQPDYVLHLAAQALVRASYADPVGTFRTNVQGTVHVLEGLRSLAKPCVVVCVTTDKCYENREWLYGYREDDPLGGHDPYSASKAAAEIVAAAYRRSFFSGGPVRVASARAGNVIGGGDWAADRMVPDCIRALSEGREIPVRNRHATRPWQHVLEPLAGYLWLAVRTHADPALAGAFNFGPGRDANRTVSELVEEVLRHWPGRWIDHTPPEAPHEAGRLQLSIDKADALLGWAPAWTFAEAVGETVRWYRGVAAGGAGAAARWTRDQIARYTDSARRRGLAWANPSPGASKRLP